MESTSSGAGRRAEIMGELFPRGVPQLWCPLLTHYNSKGGIDEQRTAKHLQHLAPFVKGFLIPGSTGDGWELNDAETRRVINIALQQAQRLEFFLLIGVLKPDTESTLAALEQIAQRIVEAQDESDSLLALKKARVCGFAICPPTGRDVPQEEILFRLAAVLETGWPLALYQLPQVTKNEMSPDTVKDLADRFPNFILFKDTSGNDRAVLSRKDFGGVFKLRGAETDYSKWLSAARGAYDGFLLSTANCFASELARMIEHAHAGQADAARAISDRLSAIIIEVFQLVSPIISGNGFANANKAMDHLFAFGSKAVEMPPPRLHDGTVIPRELIRRAAELLARHDVLPREGYLT